MKQLPMPADELTIEGRVGFLILPDERAVGEATPWVWYAPTLPRHPDKTERWMFEQFLAAGIAIAGLNVGESFGSPDGVALFAGLYEELTTQRGMSKTPVLLARSRGGLMLYNWAVERPECVAGIAGIYPVVDIASYPGVERAAGAHGLSTEQLTQQLASRNPIDRLAPLAASRVPIFHIQGDADQVVPLEANSGTLKGRYEALGGAMRLEVIEGGGHDMSAHWFHSQRLVDFVIQCAGAE